MCLNEIAGDLMGTLKIDVRWSSYGFVQTYELVNSVRFSKRECVLRYFNNWWNETNSKYWHRELKARQIFYIVDLLHLSVYSVNRRSWIEPIFPTDFHPLFEQFFKKPCGIGQLHSNLFHPLLNISCCVNSKI